MANTPPWPSRSQPLRRYLRSGLLLWQLVQFPQNCGAPLFRVYATGRARDARNRLREGEAAGGWTGPGCNSLPLGTPSRHLGVPRGLTVPVGPPCGWTFKTRLLSLPAALKKFQTWANRRQDPARRGVTHLRADPSSRCLFLVQKKIDISSVACGDKTCYRWVAFRMNATNRAIKPNALSTKLEISAIRKTGWDYVYIYISWGIPSAAGLRRRRGRSGNGPPRMIKYNILCHGGQGETSRASCRGRTGEARTVSEALVFLMIIDKAMSLLVGRFMGCGEMNKTNKDINEIKLERIRTKINPDHVRHVYIYIHSYIYAQTLFVFYSTDASANMSTDPTAIKCIALPAHARRSLSDTAAA